MAKRSIVFPVPVQGLDKRWSYQDQPPQTTPDCLNVRARDPRTGRVRLAQREGISKALTAQVGGAANPLQMLTDFTTVTNTNVQEAIDEDEFDRPADTDPGEGWSASSWWAGRHKLRSNETLYVSSSQRNAADIRHPLGFEFTEPYSIQVDLKMLEGWDVEESKFLYARMDEASPDYETDGVRARIRVAGDGPYGVSGELKVYVGGEEVAEHTFTNTTFYKADLPITYRVSIDGDSISVSLGQHTLLGSTVISSQAGTAVGIGTTRVGHDPLALDNWKAIGTKIAKEAAPPQTRLWAAAAGSIYEENDGQGFDERTEAAASIQDEHIVMATQLKDELFIAEYQSVLEQQTDGVIGGGSHNELTSASVTDFTALGIDTDTMIVELYDCDTPGPTAGVYEIQSLTADTLTLASSADADGNCSFRIDTAPRVYTPGIGVQMLVGVGSDAPYGCRILTRWQGRLVWGGTANDPQNWFMSAINDGRDYDYTASTEAAAVAGNNSDFGVFGEPLRTAIPFTDDYLLFGCEGSLWRLSGNPMAGGALDSVTYKTGVLDRFAWCAGPGGQIWFMGPDGMHVVGATGRGEPKMLSSYRLPSELTDLNPLTNEVILQWDHRVRGVFVYITPRATGDTVHYFFDPERGAFWPDQYPANVGPVIAHSVSARTGSVQGLLMGGRDGYIRQYDPEAALDDGETIQSYCQFAPQYLMGHPSVEGTLTSLEAVLGDGNGTLDYELRTAATHKDALTSRRVHRGNWRLDGAQSAVRQRLRGISVALKVSNERADQWWSVETITGQVKRSGRRRV